MYNNIFEARCFKVEESQFSSRLKFGEPAPAQFGSDEALRAEDNRSTGVRGDDILLRQGARMLREWLGLFFSFIVLLNLLYRLYLSTLPASMTVDHIDSLCLKI